MRPSIPLIIFLGLISTGVFATHFRDGGFLADKGILETMRIDPPLPAQGESFTVRLSGSWPEVSPAGVCRGPLEFSELVIYPGNMVQIVSLPQQDSYYCDQPPASWSFDVTIPANAWQAVNENGFLRVEHNLFSGVNMLTGINQVFDLRLGTHEVPAFIGSGFWTSPDLRFEGILVEQQGSRVLFYGLRYDRKAARLDEGEPVWQLVSGEMYGNSTLGRSYRFDWPMDENNEPAEVSEESEILSANDSGAIIVHDYNHIRVFTETNGNLGTYHDYTRAFFGIDKGRLPKYVPPLDGRWTLYGYDGQTREFTMTLELMQGSEPSENLFRFASPGGGLLATCQVTAPGDGDCHIARESDGLDFGFPLTAFQGNLARGSLETGGGTLDGVLVRQPWQLPLPDESQ